MKRGCAGALLLLCACTNVVTNLASDRKSLVLDASNAPLDAATAKDAAMRDAASTGPRVPANCGGHVCACDDGADNDADGRSDGFDPECTNPNDDDESSFATGAHAGKSGCRDCFWDNNAGSGDDDCRYPVECLTGAAAPGKGSCSSCEVSATCVDRCAAATPNGCDCFGCCEIEKADGSSVQVELTDTCSLALLDDANACPRCQQSASCRNPCGHCELCPGRTPETLPADCKSGSDTTPGYVCDERQQVCSAASPCTSGLYCQLGCCLWEVE